MWTKICFQHVVDAAPVKYLILLSLFNLLIVVWWRQFCNDIATSGSVVNKFLILTFWLTFSKSMMSCLYQVCHCYCRYQKTNEKLHQINDKIVQSSAWVTNAETIPAFSSSLYLFNMLCGAVDSVKGCLFTQVKAVLTLHLFYISCWETEIIIPFYFTFIYCS